MQAVAEYEGIAQTLAVCQCAPAPLCQAPLGLAACPARRYQKGHQPM